MEGGSDAAAERAVDAATLALSRYEFFRVHEEPLGERPTFGSGPPAAAARLHESDRPKVLVCRSTKAYRRLALCVPRPGERTVDIGSAYGDATALMAEAAGKDAVLGIDVSKHFVNQSSAARPGLRFERLDALEDPALLAREIEGSVNVFVDIGGVRAAEALVRLLPAVAKSASPSFIVVKCEALHDAMADAEVPFEGLRGATTITRFTVPECERSSANTNEVEDCDTDGSGGSRWRDAVVVTASSASPVFWRKTCEREVGNVRARSAFKRAHVARSARPASDLFARYPLKYPPRFVRGDVEICRFHNYSADGCIRREKFGMCMFDHEHCHWCGEHGHRAWECEHAVTAHQSAVVDDGLAPAAPPVRDPNDGTANGVANGTASGGVDGGRGTSTAWRTESTTAWRTFPWRNPRTCTCTSRGDVTAARPWVSPRGTPCDGSGGSEGRTSASPAVATAWRRQTASCSPSPAEGSSRTSPRRRRSTSSPTTRPPRGYPRVRSRRRGTR